MAILRDKIGAQPDVAETPDAPANEFLDELHDQLERVARHNVYSFRQYLDDLLSSGSAAALFLTIVAERLNPQPDTETEGAFTQDMLGRTGLTRWFIYRGPLPPNVKETMARDVARYGDYLDRFYEELRLRIGTVRGKLALIMRFKGRCEWHDRDRLRLLALGAQAPEEALTAELARWLYDHGLNPLTRARAAGLEPDVLDPTEAPSFYIEAKRYRRSARSYLVRGVHQVNDTVGRLYGSAYEVHEAFYVVFREGGPRYAFPEAIPGVGWTVYPVLIDIAEARVSGSRQTRPPVGLPLSAFTG